MGNVRRMWFSGVVALVICALTVSLFARAPAALAKKKVPHVPLRFISEFEALERRFVEDDRPTLQFVRAGYKKVKRKLRPRSKSLRGEARFAFQLVGFIQDTPDPDDPDQLLFGNEYDAQIAEVVAAFDAKADSEIARAELFIEYLRSEGFDVTKETEVLDLAKAVLSDARLQGTDDNYFFVVREVFRLTRKIRVFMVRTATDEKLKQCKGRKLKGEEYCNALLGGTVETFQHGVGEIIYNRFDEVSNIRVTFEACPTKSHLPHTIQLLIKPRLGVQEIDGFYSRTDGSGFGQAYRTGEVNVTGLNLAAGYIEGEFDFTTKTTVCKDARFVLISLKGFKR